MLLLDDEIIKKTNMSESELRQEIARFLFLNNKITIEDAAKLACMTKKQFEKLLAASNHLEKPAFNDDNALFFHLRGKINIDEKVVTNLRDKSQL